MANQCYNLIEFTGPKELMDTLYENMNASRGSKEKFEPLQALYPEPETFEKFSFKNLVTGHPASEEQKWYYWRIENWGTKSCDGDVTYSDNNDGTVTLHMDLTTANSPAIYAFRLFQNLHPEAVDLEYLYYEPDMQIAGSYISKGAVEELRSYTSIDDIILKTPRSEWEPQFEEIYRAFNMEEEEWRFEEAATA